MDISVFSVFLRRGVGIVRMLQMRSRGDRNQKRTVWWEQADLGKDKEKFPD